MVGFFRKKIDTKLQSNPYFPLNLKPIFGKKYENIKIEKVRRTIKGNFVFRFWNYFLDTGRTKVPVKAVVGKV